MLNTNLDAERLPLEEERLNRFWKYAGMMSELSLKKSANPILASTFSWAMNRIVGKATIPLQSLYAFLNLDFDIDNHEVEILEKNFKNYYSRNVSGSSSSQAEMFSKLIADKGAIDIIDWLSDGKGKIDIIDWPSDEDYRFDKISEIITDSKTFYGYNENTLYLYSLISTLDGVYGKNESRFIAKIFRKCKFNEELKGQLDEFIKELCQHEQKIEEAKNSSMSYKEVLSEIEKIVEQEENSVKDLYEFIQGMYENGDENDDAY